MNLTVPVANDPISNPIFAMSAIAHHRGGVQFGNVAYQRWWDRRLLQRSQRGLNGEGAAAAVPSASTNADCISSVKFVDN
jgi:hypothetical protein